MVATSSILNIVAALCNVDIVDVEFPEVLAFSMLEEKRICSSFDYAWSLFMNAYLQGYDFNYFSLNLR